jgi:hypothetical protein
MKKNKRFYTFSIDSNLEYELKNFEKQLKESEEIISQVASDGKLIITTEEIIEDLKRPKNLLLEEISVGKRFPKGCPLPKGCQEDNLGRICSYCEGSGYYTKETTFEGPLFAECKLCQGTGKL